MIGRLVLITLILTCTACAVSRPSITYLQLQGRAPATAADDDPVIVLDAVLLPDYLLRDEFVSRLSEARLRYDPDYRWAEPLDLGIQRVLAAELEHQLATRRVLRFPAMAQRTPDWRLDIEVFTFERQNREVVLHAEGLWSEGTTPGETAAAVHFRESSDLGENAQPEQVALALSALLQDFAEALARGLDDYNKTDTPSET